MKTLLAIICALGNCILSDASYSDIAGYKPGSKVTSHNAIDLDQMALEEALSKPTIDYELVKNIYTQGGNSKTYAEFSVPPLEPALKKGDSVKGKVSGAQGKVYSSTAKQATTLKVAYATSDNQATYVDCKGGALPDPPGGKTPSAMKPYKWAATCFQQEDLEVMPSGATSSIIIKPNAVPKNKAGRTLYGFSAKAGKTMTDQFSEDGGCGARPNDRCKPAYKDFKQYSDYYGDHNYAHKLVQAGIDGAYTSFSKTDKNGAHQYDLTGSSNAIRVQIIKKGTAYMNAYMYAIREFEDAIDDCLAGCRGADDTSKDCNALSANAVHAWDEGVAFYTGSLEGAAVGGNGAGKLSYRLAEKRCKNFNTCTEGTKGISSVNSILFDQLNEGNSMLLKGLCDHAEPLVGNIVALMSVPLIQGTLRYAYKVDQMSGGDKEKAEGAIFAAAIVPRVAACDAEDAQTIMVNMRIGAKGTNFTAVKKAFENNYGCMSITCKHVGGLLDTTTYHKGAEPCEDPTTTKNMDVSLSSAIAPSLVLIAAAMGLLP